ncbi:ATP-binding protein [Clostridium mediterraneense]|uniref:ATP-binding protein n=1 Tax=Clostridium mediterraneense TaxID=1805472 RepID=UPI000836939D|nr:ATP-binding protein [Clostridium mediterraneense]
MELIYMYLDKCNSLNNMNINFGGKYKLNYLKDEKILNISKDEKYIEDFFNVTEENNIINVTGIIGENGSGKSTILENIGGIIFNNRILKAKDKDIFSHEIILAFIIDGELMIFCHNSFIKDVNDVIYSDDLKVKVIIYGGSNNNIVSNEEYDFVRESDLIKKFNCIYFSNIYDNKFPKIITDKYRNYYDISINGMLEVTGKKETTLYGMDTPRKRNEDEAIANNKYGINIFKALKLKQISDQIQLVLNNKIHDEDIILPQIINLSCEFIHGQPNEYTYLRFYNDNLEKSKTEEKIYKLLDSLSNKDSDYDINLSKKIFLIAILDNYFVEMQRPIENFKEFKKYKNFVTDKYDLKELLEYYFKVWEEYINLSKKETEDVNRIIDRYRYVHKKYISLIDRIIKIIEDSKNKKNIKGGMFCKKNRIGVSTFYEKYTTIDINIKENSEILLEIIDILKNLNTDQNILSFRWRNISSGEYAMMEIYSRIYNVIVKNISEQETIILLIDEGEIYLHPEWQRVYLYKLFKFLNKELKQYKIQIVFTSNTPLIITDIPRNNLIMLEKNISKEISRSLLSSDISQTFASNINSLLTRSFFMKSTIGEFSKFKINNVLEFLMKEDYKGDIDRNKALIIINSIGEPIIRKKLLELYKKKYKEDVLIGIEREIEMLIEDKGNKDKLEKARGKLINMLNEIESELEE